MIPRSCSSLARAVLVGATGFLLPASALAADATSPVLPAARVSSQPAPGLPVGRIHPRVAQVESAVHALAIHVEQQSHPDALRMAVEAYLNFRRTHPEQVRNPYLYYVDYGLGNRTPRGYVFDMDALELVEGPFTVAHGRGSPSDENGVPTRFSNIPGSLATSLGLFVTQESYRFVGTAGGRTYHSVGLRLRGVSGRFNSAARDRRVVAHGAPYVTADRAGRSEGCPAMEPDRAQRLIPLIRDGGLVFLFSPRDRLWLREERWAQVAGARSGWADE